MARSENITGAVLMMASMAAFTLNDALLKLMAGDVPLSQLMFLRGVLTSIAVAIIAWRMNVFVARPTRQDWTLIFFRTLAEIGAAYCFLTALFNMPIANVMAILQALPLTVTLAAAVFLNEPVGWRRLSAILIGFVGVMLIVRPGGEAFNAYTIYALAAVGFVTLRDLTTRRLSAQAPSMLVTFCASVALMVVFGLASATEPWTPMGTREVGLTAGAAVMIIGAYLCSIMVMRVGDIAFVAPFRYTGFIWALVLGLVLFGEWPDLITMIGVVIVVGSGLFMLYREFQLSRQSARALPSGRH